MAVHSPARCWTSACDLAQPCTGTCDLAQPRTSVHRSVGSRLAGPSHPLPDLVSPNEAQGCRSSHLEATVVLLPPEVFTRGCDGGDVPTAGTRGDGAGDATSRHGGRLGAGCGSCAGGGWPLPHGHASPSRGTVTACCRPPHGQVSGSPRGAPRAAGWAGSVTGNCWQRGQMPPALGTVHRGGGDSVGARWAVMGIQWVPVGNWWVLVAVMGTQWVPMGNWWVPGGQ